MHVWLFKIARNTVVDHVRKMSKRKTVALGELEIRLVRSDDRGVDKRVIVC